MSAPLVALAVVAVLTTALSTALTTASVGTALASAPSRSATSAPAHPFTDVSCPRVHDCYAVGTNPWPGSGAPFVAHLVHGTWSFARPPWPTAGRYGQLDAIDCFSTSVCVAVGSSRGAKGGHQQDLSLRLSHRRWHLKTFAAPHRSVDTMKDVSCAGRSRCVAVAEGPSGRRSVAYSLAGGRWTQTTVARPAGEPADTRLELSGLSCASTTHCVSVGSDSHTGNPVTATLSAGSWTATALPVPENGATSLSYGVARISCATTSSCVAVGDRENRHGVLAPFVSAFQSGVWTFTTLPRLTAGNGNLGDVDCLSSHRCFAVGNQGNQGTRVLTEGLYGGSWRGAVHSTKPATSWNDVSCTSTTCVAVGGRSGTTRKGRTFEDGVSRTFSYAG
jgi:hypothetical protein